MHWCRSGGCCRANICWTETNAAMAMSSTAQSTCAQTASRKLGDLEFQLIKTCDEKEVRGLPPCRKIGAAMMLWSHCPALFCDHLRRSHGDRDIVWMRRGRHKGTRDYARLVSEAGPCDRPPCSLATKTGGVSHLGWAPQTVSRARMTNLRNQLRSAGLRSRVVVNATHRDGQPVCGQSN